MLRAPKVVLEREIPHQTNTRLHARRLHPRAPRSEGPIPLYLVPPSIFGLTRLLPPLLCVVRSMLSCGSIRYFTRNEPPLVYFTLVRSLTFQLISFAGGGESGDRTPSPDGIFPTTWLSSFEPIISLMGWGGGHKALPYLVARKWWPGEGLVGRALH